MEDPRLRILKLLEEGKITAEEAERLLRAVEEPPRRRGGPWRGWRGFAGMMGMVGDIVAETLRMVPEMIRLSVSGEIQELHEEIAAEGVRRLHLQITAGDFELHTHDEPKVRLEGEGALTVNREGEALTLKIMGGDFEIWIPQDLELSGKWMGGDASLRGAFRRLNIEGMGGDLELKLAKHAPGKLYYQGGDLLLSYPKDTPFLLQVKLTGGALRLPEGVQVQEGRIWHGEAEGLEPLQIEMIGGDFRVRFA